MASFPPTGRSARLRAIGRLFHRDRAHTVGHHRTLRPIAPIDDLPRILAEGLEAASRTLVGCSAAQHLRQPGCLAQSPQPCDLNRISRLTAGLKKRPAAGRFSHRVVSGPRPASDRGFSRRQTASLKGEGGGEGAKAGLGLDRRDKGRQSGLA